MLKILQARLQQYMNQELPDVQAGFRKGRVCVCVCCLFSHFSHVQLFAILWTIARQVSLSMGFSRQEYQRGLTCPSAGGLPDPGNEPMFLAFPALQADSLPLSHKGSLKGGITRNQIANICWIIEKAGEFQKNIYFCFIVYKKAFKCVDHSKLENS